MGKRKFFCHDTDLKNNLDAVRELSEIKMEDLPWGENERENLFVHDPEAYAGQPFVTAGTMYLKDPKLNMNKSYDIVIRGDVYENVSCEKGHSYYDFAFWGEFSNLGLEGAKYPFCLAASWPDEYNPIWDEDGNWVGTVDMIDYWGYPNILVDQNQYPDLKPEEIEIYDASIPAITKMSGKYVEGMGYEEVSTKSLIKERWTPEYAAKFDVHPYTWTAVPSLGILVVEPGLFSEGSSFRVKVRDSVYEMNVRIVDNYYDFVFVGEPYYLGLNAEPAEGIYPFTIGSTCTLDSSDFPLDSVEHLTVLYDPEKLPELTLEEIEIYPSTKVRTIDPKYLPFTLTTFYCSNEMEGVLWYNADDVGTYTGMVTYADAAKAVESGIIRFALPYGDAITYAACVMCSVDPEAGMVMLASAAGGQFGIARS